MYDGSTGMFCDSKTSLGRVADAQVVRHGAQSQSGAYVRVTLYFALRSSLFPVVLDLSTRISQIAINIYEVEVLLL